MQLEVIFTRHTVFIIIYLHGEEVIREIYPMG